MENDDHHSYTPVAYDFSLSGIFLFDSAHKIDYETILEHIFAYQMIWMDSVYYPS